MSTKPHPDILPIPPEYIEDKLKNQSYIQRIRQIFKEEAMKNPKQSFRILPPIKED
jgi:hypothetical protein